MGQRIFGLALGYEDLNDHDELRKDPTLAVLAGKLSPVLRTDCDPLAGKSTLNRLEHTPRRHASKYHKIDCDGAQVDALLVDLFLEAHERAPREIVLDLDVLESVLGRGLRFSRARAADRWHGIDLDLLAALFEAARLLSGWRDGARNAVGHVAPRLALRGGLRDATCNWFAYKLRVRRKLLPHKAEKH